MHEINKCPKVVVFAFAGKLVVQCTAGSGLGALSHLDSLSHYTHKSGPQILTFSMEFKGPLCGYTLEFSWLIHRILLKFIMDSVIDICFLELGQLFRFTGGRCLRHSDCPAEQYCTEGNTCENCSLCFELDDAHDGRCPRHCNVTTTVGTMQYLILN